MTPAGLENPMAPTRRTRSTPTPRWRDPGADAPHDKQMDAARYAGLDLPPDDARAAWVERRDDLVAAYHDGQAERYEREDW